MKKKELQALEANGWKIGTIQELLDLPDEDVLFIEMKVALAKAVKEKRKKQSVSQTQLAGPDGLEPTASREAREGRRDYRPARAGAAGAGAGGSLP